MYIGRSEPYLEWLSKTASFRLTYSRHKLLSSVRRHSMEPPATPVTSQSRSAGSFSRHFRSASHTWTFLHDTQNTERQSSNSWLFQPAC